jgi:signal transduction histidine kinase
VAQRLETLDQSETQTIVRGGNQVSAPALPEALAQYSNVLHRIALTANSSLALKDTLKTLGNLALEAIPADRCHLLLLDESGMRALPTFSVGRVTDLRLWDRFRKLEPIDLKGAPGRWEVFMKGRAIAVPDMTAAPEIIPKEAMEVFGSRAAIFVPLKAGDEALGVLSIDWVGSSRSFDFAEVELAEVIGAYAALAIRNARVHEKLQGRLQRAEILSRLSDVVVGTASLSVAVRRLNKFLGPELGISIRSISIANRQVREAVGGHEPGEEDLKAIRSWRSMLAKSQAVPKPRKTGRVLLVPVVHGNRVQGALRLVCKGAGQPEDKLLQAIATGCGEVIYKAGLRRDLAATELRLAIAAERDRIARDLHDSVGQILHMIGLRLSQYLAESPDETWRVRLEELHDLAGRGNVQVRESIRALLFLDVRRKGLVRSLKDLAAKFSANTGIDALVRLEGDPVAIPAADEEALFRVAHEALVNVERHARASMVNVTLRYTRDEVTVTVRDDGVGLIHRDPFGVKGPHFGLRGLQKLVSQLGGSLTVRNAAPRGVVDEARLPRPRDGRSRPDASGQSRSR